MPGDVGYIQGNNPTDHMLSGEWVVYEGGLTWWGADNPPVEQTLVGWIQTVTEWSSDPKFRAYVAAKRIYPGVGLRWHPPGP